MFSAQIEKNAAGLVSVSADTASGFERMSLVIRYSTRRLKQCVGRDGMKSARSARLSS